MRSPVIKAYYHIRNYMKKKLYTMWKFSGKYNTGFTFKKKRKKKKRHDIATVQQQEQEVLECHLAAFWITFFDIFFCHYTTVRAINMLAVQVYYNRKTNTL